MLLSTVDQRCAAKPCGKQSMAANLNVNAAAKSQCGGRAGVAMARRATTYLFCTILVIIIQIRYTNNVLVLIRAGGTMARRALFGDTVELDEREADRVRSVRCARRKQPDLSWHSSRAGAAIVEYSALGFDWLPALMSWRV